MTDTRKLYKYHIKYDTTKTSVKNKGNYTIWRYKVILKPCVTCQFLHSQLSSLPVYKMRHKHHPIFFQYFVVAVVVAAVFNPLNWVST